MVDRPAKTRRSDPNQSAKLIVDIATGADGASDMLYVDGKNQAAVMLGRLGGVKGGIARAASLSPERRKSIAQKAAAARWKKDV